MLSLLLTNCNLFSILGAPGQIGIQGPTGPQGFAGPSGLSVLKGERGSPGPLGPYRAKGDKVREPNLDFLLTHGSQV